MQPQPTPTRWKRKLKNLLFIDLKTVAAEPDFDRLDARTKQLWTNKVSTFRRDADLSPAEWYEQRASLFAEFGQIVCAGIGGMYLDENDTPFLKVKTIADTDERAVLLEVSELISKYPAGELTLCAHNGKEFDYPYLCRRLVIHGLPLPAALQLTGRKPWDIPHQDTLELWQFGDKRHFIPLDLLAAVLDVSVDLPAESVEETTVAYHTKQPDLESIRAAARESIVALAQVYLRLIGAPLVADNHITRLP